MDLLVWVTASSRAAVQAAYARAAAEVTGVPDADADRFLEYPVGTELNWLVVLDDLTVPGAPC